MNNPRKSKPRAYTSKFKAFPTPPVPSPDPQVYILAANKIKKGLDIRDAITSSVEELHSCTSKGVSKDEFHHWIWQHVDQYRSSFGFSMEFLSVSTTDELISEDILNSRTLIHDSLKYQALVGMASLCLT